MHKAAKKYVGKKKVAQKNRGIMTPKIKEAIKNRNELRKKISTHREEWLEACRVTSEIIQEEKEERWKEHVAQLNRTTDTKAFWRTIRGVDGRKTPDRRNEVLEVDGKTYIENEDKAEQFGETYRQFSQEKRQGIE